MSASSITPFPPSPPFPPAGFTRWGMPPTAPCRGGTPLDGTRGGCHVGELHSAIPPFPALPAGGFHPLEQRPNLVQLGEGLHRLGVGFQAGQVLRRAPR